MNRVIVGIGSDVAEIVRVRQAIERHGEHFLKRILSPRELNEAASWGTDRKAEFTAGRFAAKEAIAKALGCGIGRLGMKDVDVCLGERGLSARFLGDAQAFDKLGQRCHVSISHTRDIAFAVAILEQSARPLDE